MSQVLKLKDILQLTLVQPLSTKEASFLRLFSVDAKLFSKSSVQQWRNFKNLFAVDRDRASCTRKNFLGDAALQKPCLKKFFTAFWLGGMCALTLLATPMTADVQARVILWPARKCTGWEVHDTTYKLDTPSCWMYFINVYDSARFFTSRVKS